MQTGRWKLRFVLVACALMAAAVLYEARIGAPPALLASETSPGVIDPSAVVSVVRSAQEDAADIEYDEVKALVREAAELAGGFGRVIADGDTVVLKPNLVSPYDQTYTPQDLPQEVNGITTDWRVVQAAADLVREVNPSGRVIVLEGVANETTRTSMAQLGYTPDRMVGVDDFVHLEDRSGGWREWDSPLLVSVTLPEGVGLYPDQMKVNQSPEFYLNRIYYEADVVISVPVLKNHSMTGITGAVKNVGIGATPTNIYGASPGDNHRSTNDTIVHTRRLNLHQWIHDYYACRPVDFAIMDGLQGTWDGPTGSGSLNLADAQRNMRLILASRDSVALDAIASLIMDYDPALITHLVQLHNDGFGCVEPSRIRVEGVEPSSVRTRFRNRRGGTAFYYDHRSPEVSIGSCVVEGGTLLLALAADGDAAKAEIYVDGEHLDGIVVEGFDDVRLSLPEVAPGHHTVTVRVYDRYLNVTVLDFEIEAP